MEKEATSVFTSMQIRERVSTLVQLIHDAKGELEKLRKQCSHGVQRKIWRKLSTDRYQFKVVGYRCVDCTRNFGKRREGERCAVCDGNEKLVGYIPGQGGGEHVYRCEDCGRSSTSDEYGVYPRSIPEHDFMEE
ncbi:MAG: hypothetical protein G01um101429_355 [Parcubacteria group bacterium Gr01-1014_29]|nr:MAG: hypothetical protein G01um101429_355 [Parcubacteria group bacterium Gr01-1014_29]